MPTNLHALIRYRIIDRCLRDPDHSWTWLDLSRACSAELESQMGIRANISRRTIMYDISHMKSGKLGYHAPIEYDRKEKSYYYSSRKFSIDNVPLKSEHIDDLKNVLLMLRQFSGKENMRGIQEIIVSLESQLNIQRLGDGKKPIIFFEHSLNKAGQKWLDDLYKATESKKCITIEYRPFEKDTIHLTISPYALKEYNGRWFLFGFNHDPEVHKIINIGLDRIQGYKFSVKPFMEDAHFSTETYLSDIVGVSVLDDQKKQKIKFRAYNKQARYIETKPIHSSQQLSVKDDQHSDFMLEVIPNYELESKFLALGEHVEVLSPKKLRNKIQKRIQEAAERYD